MASLRAQHQCRQGAHSPFKPVAGMWNSSSKGPSPQHCSSTGVSGQVHFHGHFRLWCHLRSTTVTLEPLDTGGRISPLASTVATCVSVATGSISARRQIKGQWQAPHLTWEDSITQEITCRAPWEGARGLEERAFLHLCGQRRVRRRNSTLSQWEWPYCCS